VKRIEAEREMQNKTQIAMEMRRELVNSMRPRNVKAIVDLITETESGLSFHLQKFAILCETLAAQQGQAVMPFSSGKLGTSLKLRSNVRFYSVNGTN
jgi:Rho GTPase-activating protein RGD1